MCKLYRSAACILASRVCHLRRLLAELACAHVCACALLQFCLADHTSTFLTWCSLWWTSDLRSIR